MNVTHGLDAKNYYPGVVKILISDQGVCTGSVVSNNTVITAAHCVYGFDAKHLKIVLDDGKEIQVKKAIAHPLYEEYMQKKDYGHADVYDLGVIVVDDNSFKSIPRYRVIRSYKPNVGDLVTMVGYGCRTTKKIDEEGYMYVDCVKASVKRYGKNWITESTSCRKEMLEVRETDYKSDDDENPFPIKGLLSSTAEGDSGGPLLLGVDEIIGVASSSVTFEDKKKIDKSDCFTNLAHPENIKFLREAKDKIGAFITYGL